MVIFNGDECKFIADFYATNYKILSGSATGEKINEKRNAKITELTKEINSNRPTSKVTEKQVREKIQSLKKDAKDKNATNNRVKKPTGGGKDKTKRLSAAQEILVARLGNTTAFRGLAGGGLESGVRNESGESQPENSDVEDSFDQGDQLQQSQQSQQSQQQLHRPPMSIELRQNRTSPRPMPQLSPVVTQSALDETAGSSSRPSNVAHARASRSRTKNRLDELDEEKKAILLLQKETLETQKELISNQLKATQEFRFYLLEKRMAMRGTNLVDAPLDVDEDLLAHQALLMR